MTSNISVNDIIISNRATREGLAAVYDKDGNLVPSVVTPSSIRNSISERMLNTGDTMTGSINMNNNKIINVKESTDDLDAATKVYVDDKNLPVMTSLSTINDGITSFKTEFSNHVQLLNFRIDVNRTINEVFGSPNVVDIKLSDINAKLNDIISEITDIVETNNLVKIPYKQIIQQVYTISSGSATWTKLNSTIKHTAEVTGVYGQSILSGEKFSIFTTYLWRHSTVNLSGTVSVVLNKDVEKTFLLEPSDNKITTVSYWWCLEFVAETPQLT